MPEIIEQSVAKSATKSVAKITRSTIVADKIANALNIREKKRRTPVEKAARRKLFSIDKCKCENDPLYTPSSACDPELRKLFKSFKGYWLLNSIDDFQICTLIRFYIDEEEQLFKAKFFSGLLSEIREVQAQERPNTNIPSVYNEETGDMETCTIQILSSSALRLFNMVPVLSTDNLRSTFTIQENGDEAAVILWSDWDGTSDDPSNGFVETLMLYRRLPGRPEIQPAEGPHPDEWLYPLPLFDYVKRYYLEMSQPQKSLAGAWIGPVAYENLYRQMLTRGVQRVSTSSTVKRGGHYIGVWKTMFPEIAPVTTINTASAHHFNIASLVEVSGLKGAYAEINGSHRVSLFDLSTNNPLLQEPWVKNGSSVYNVALDYDSSGIQEEYNPKIHGVATLRAQHGPINENVGYRDFFAAVIDFVATAFGTATHNQLAGLINGFDFIETFEEMREALLTPGAPLGYFTSGPLRTYSANSYALYWNPALLSVFPVANINDPFGLGDPNLLFDEKFNYDITLENYVDSAATYHIYFTVTGSVDLLEPITGQLTDYGYTSNGSEVVFRTVRADETPEPLVDRFGTHPWMLYGAADGSEGSVAVAKAGFFGAEIKPELTGGEKVAYIRIGSEDAVDSPLYAITSRPLAFNKNGFEYKAQAMWVGAWASMAAKLKESSPDRVIVDIRNNAGGHAQACVAIASVFGGDRYAGEKKISRPGPELCNLVDVSVEDVQTYFGAVSGDANMVSPSAVKRAYPDGVFENVEVIVLTSTHSASGGDLLPHYFIGPDPASTVHDLGSGVTSRIVGNIDGRLLSGLKYFDAVPIASVDQRALPLMFASEAGLVEYDRHGPTPLPQPWMAPDLLLPGWYDDTIWQDLGKTKIKREYPLGDLKPKPDYEDRSTWRDVWLENAIVN